MASEGTINLCLASVFLFDSQEGKRYTVSAGILEGKFTKGGGVSDLECNFVAFLL